MDGTVLRFGKLRGSEAMIEQVKGFSYSASSLLGGASFFPDTTNGETNDEHSEEINKSSVDSSKHSSLHTSFASPKLYDGASVRYCNFLIIYYCSRFSDKF